jgi:hypothetical protein
MQTRALLQHERGVTKAAQVGLDRRDAIHPTAVVLVVPWRIWLESASVVDNRAYDRNIPTEANKVQGTSPLSVRMIAVSQYSMSQKGIWAVQVLKTRGGFTACIMIVADSVALPYYATMVSSL